MKRNKKKLRNSTDRNKFKMKNGKGLAYRNLGKILNPRNGNQTRIKKEEIESLKEIL